MTDQSDETLALVDTAAPISVQELDACISDLEVLEFVGKGGMGAVYRARQTRLERDVALKVLLPSAADADFHEQFQTEARAMARLSHPNVVVVHDFGRAGELDYLVMEFIRGQTLRSMLAKQQIAPDTAYSVTTQICQALDYAHEEGVIHRDIKPENILIENRGRVRLADFGLARLLSSTRAPDDARVVGTPGYIAPELLANPRTADHRVDIYSTGALIYELLTGERYRDNSPAPSARGFPDQRMDEVVKKALQGDPALRYQRARDLDEDVSVISRTDDSTVVIRQTLAATPEEVFRAWTDRKEVEQFLAPSDEMTTSVAELSPTVGGRFCLTMKGEGKHTARGQYCRIERPDRLSFTWAWDEVEHEPNEGQITIRLRPHTTGTELTLIHERLSSRQSRDNHLQGWSGVMDRLQRKFES